MSNRGVLTSSNYYANLVSRDTYPVDLVMGELGNYLGEGPVRMTTASNNITIPAGNGDLTGDYQAAGGLLEISAFEETTQLTVSEITFTLSGVDGAVISQLLNWPYLDRNVKLWRGLLDENLDMIELPVLIFDGRINAAGILDDALAGASTITVTCSSQWSDFERKNGSKTNDAEQQLLFPGDLGMQFAARSVAQIKWGRE